MLLNNKKINDIWHAGFCEETVEHARTTHEHESHKRIEFLKRHIQTCDDCRKANLLKEIEGRVAEVMGIHAVNVFAAGGDISILDGFRKTLRVTLVEFMHAGRIDAAFFNWMALKALRQPLDYFEVHRK